MGMTTLTGETRFVLRSLARTPAFALAAILLIGLGVGVNTAMFSVANTLIRKPMLLPNLDRTVLLFQVDDKRKDNLVSLTSADYHDARQLSRSFDKMAAFEEVVATMTTRDFPQHVVAAAVQPGFFSVLQSVPWRGRVFTEGAGSETAQEVVISYRFWQTAMGADPSVIGRTMELDGKSYLVLGVMPLSFGFPLGVDLWMPLPDSAAHAYDRSEHRFGVVATLLPGVTQTQANAELQVISRSLETAHPDTNRGWTLRAVPLTDFITGGLTSQYIYFLLGGVVFVLVMASSNVANLLLARATARQKELAVRQALGASRWQMVRPLLVESSLIGLGGAIVSLPLAMIALKMIRIHMPASVVRYLVGFDSIGLDYAALAFALGIALLSGLVAGIMPAVQMARLNTSDILKEGGREVSSSNTNHRLRQFLLCSQIALAMTLLVGTTLMVKGLSVLGNIIPGGAPEKVLTFRLDLPTTHYADLPACGRFLNRVQDELASLPQVESLAIASNIPYGGYGTTMEFTPEGAPLLRLAESRTARTESISPSYLRTLHIGIEAGRNFSLSDGPGTMPVALLSASLAKHYWPRGDALNHRFRLDEDPNGPWYTVVGITEDVRYNWLDRRDSPTIYFSLAQAPRRAAFVLLRTSNPEAVMRAVQMRVHRLDPGQPIESLKTWAQVISESMIGLSYVAVIMSVLGVVALSLASFGLYGLMSQEVRTKRKDIGIRIALGAGHSDIVRFVVGRAAGLCLVSVALGVPCALSISFLLRKLIVGVEPLTWSAYVFPALMLLGVGLLAAYGPTRSALKTSPTELLRY